MNNYQRGFGHITIVLAVVLIGAVSLIGWRVYTMQQGTKKPTLTTSTAEQSTLSEEEAHQNEEEQASWVVYKNDKAFLTFEHPEDWKHDAKDEYSTIMPTQHSESTKEYAGAQGVLTAPSGNKMKWVYFVMGGADGGCVPGAQDKPFMPGNKCASKTIYSIEKAQAISKSPNSTHHNLFRDNMYITRTKHLSSKQGSNVTYQICLDGYNTSNDGSFDAYKIPEPGTKMGFLHPCMYRTGPAFNVTYEVKSKADFDSPEAKTAEKIMKTFNSL